MRYDYGKGVVGNSIDLKMECDDPSVEIRADIRVDEFNAKRLWGQILNCYDEPIANSLVKLVKVTCVGGKKHYEGIAHSITDCEGFYQFDVCQEAGVHYKIIVNKAVTGPEKIIETGSGNCLACECEHVHEYDPCKQYPPVIEKYNPSVYECDDEQCRPCPTCSEYQKPCKYQKDVYDQQQKQCKCHEKICKCQYKDVQKTNYASYTR